MEIQVYPGWSCRLNEGCILNCGSSWWLEDIEATRAPKNLLSHGKNARQGIDNA